MCTVPSKMYRIEVAVEIIDHVRTHRGFADAYTLFYVAHKENVPPTEPDTHVSDYLTYWRNLPLTHTILPGYVRVEDWKLPAW
jgi:hypothetical protein